MGLHKKRIENIILQDFNMVKRKSGPQTIEEKSYIKPKWRHLAIGSENYSGKRNWCLKACGFESHQPD